MSANGLEVFDRTVQTTNIWLDELMEAIGPDRQVAWKVMGTVLHKLRDRLPIGLAAHLGAQLPLLVRGAYYDQFEPAKLPTDWRSFDAFCEEVGDWLRDTRPVDPRLATLAVFRLLSNHLPEGQIGKVREALPHDVREAWVMATMSPEALQGARLDLGEGGAEDLRP